MMTVGNLTDTQFQQHFRSARLGAWPTEIENCDLVHSHGELVASTVVV